MSKASRLKRKLHYDPNPPRCSTCVHYPPTGQSMRNGTLCQLHHFYIKQIAICDSWRGRDGATLEEVEPSPQRKENESCE